MNRVRPFVTLTIMKTLYYSLVYPHLSYGIQAWGFGFQTDLNKLIILQKKIVRMMTFNDISLGIRGPLPHSAPIFKELSFLRINDILKTQVTCIIYDTLQGLSTIQFKPWFKFCIDVHDHATRNTTIVNNDEGTTDVDLTNNLFIPITRTTHYGLKTKIVEFNTKQYSKNQI